MRKFVRKWNKGSWKMFDGNTRVKEYRETDPLITCDGGINIVTFGGEYHDSFYETITDSEIT